MQFKWKGRYAKQWDNTIWKEGYVRAKRRVKTIIYIAEKGAQYEQFANISNNSYKNQIFKKTKMLTGDNVDINHVKYIRNYERKLSLTMQEKFYAQELQYNKSLIEKFPSVTTKAQLMNLLQGGVRFRSPQNVI